jgi:hypothetical protein
MKPIMRVVGIAFAFLFATSACKKSQPQTATRDRYGIGIDWPRLDTEFRDNTDPNVQAAISTIKRSILYHQFPQAIADMEKLAGNPTITNPQKKTLVDLRDQTQQVMAKGFSSRPVQ